LKIFGQTPINILTIKDCIMSSPVNTNRRKSVRGKVYIIKDRCKGCGFCVEFCPKHVLEMSVEFNSKGYHPPYVKHPDECIGCNLCGMYCPDFAIYSIRIDENKKEK
jgi:2-oxoglutarate ferredoxin oxidoreductase subunit delta